MKKTDQKTVAVFTSARSEYGLLKPLIARLKQEDHFQVKLLVGGAHFLEEQGNTYQEILNDGFTIDHKFPYLESKEAQENSAYANGVLQIQFSEYLASNPTDLIFVLGDRSELLPVVSTALLLNVPVAHISGGEITEGSTDNQVRHAVTKMAHLHFPATEIYKSNIMKMGEEDWRICVSGEPGLDSILSLPYPSKEELFSSLGLGLNKPVILSTFHSETIGNHINGAFIKGLIEQLVQGGKYQLLFTAANTDPGGIEINHALEELSTKHADVHYIKSLGKLRYYSMMKYADVMLGNSSSGLVEAQSFQLPVVNVGDRQKGRLRNKNVYDVPSGIRDVINGIASARSESFRKKFSVENNIYGDGHASEKIISYLKTVDFEKLLFKKSIF